jgi:hypothetical protein
MLGPLEDEIPSQVRKADEDWSLVEGNNCAGLADLRDAYILEHARSFLLGVPA